MSAGTGAGLSGFGAALFAALWAYSGWQFLPMAASEVQDPERNLPRAIVGGTLLVLAIYLLVNVAYLYALPVLGSRHLQLHGIPERTLRRGEGSPDICWGRKPRPLPR